MSIWGEIGKALNSTIKDQSKFESLDSMLRGIVGEIIVLDTPGTYTVRIPKIVKYAYVTACGGGGGGGKGNVSYSNTSNGCGGGGGGGGQTVIKRVLDVSSKEKLDITVGTGGAQLQAGTPTVIDDLITLIGGSPGGSATGTNNGENQTAGSGGSGGGYYTDEGYTSNYGTMGERNTGTGSLNGDGGIGGRGLDVGGAGGVGYNSNSTSVNAGKNGSKGSGGGGGGGGRYVNGVITSSNRGKGGDGYVKIEWGLAAL